MRDIETIKKELDLAREENNKAFQTAPPDMGYEKFMAYMEPTNNKVGELSREYRFVVEPNYGELPDYGDVMTLDEFIGCVESGGFIDEDGSGNYVKDGKMSDVSIFPSDVKHNSIRKDFDTIIWFNK